MDRPDVDAADFDAASTVTLALMHVVVAASVVVAVEIAVREREGRAHSGYPGVVAHRLLEEVDDLRGSTLVPHSCQRQFDLASSELSEICRDNIEVVVSGKARGLFERCR